MNEHFNIMYRGICFIIVFLFISQGEFRYVIRFRNFTMTSPTKKVICVNYTIFNYNMEHRLAYTLNVTEDIFIHYAEVSIERCTFERFACEYFQTWKFPGRVSKFVYMKNQMWSPLFISLHPKPPFPHVKKGLYVLKNGTLDARKIMSFYPDFMKYFCRFMINVYDTKNKKIAGGWAEFTINEVRERNPKNRNT